MVEGGQIMNTAILLWFSSAIKTSWVVAVHICRPSTREAEASGSPREKETVIKKRG